MAQPAKLTDVLAELLTTPPGASFKTRLERGLGIAWLAPILTLSRRGSQYPSETETAIIKRDLRTAAIHTGTPILAYREFERRRTLINGNEHAIIRYRLQFGRIPAQLPLTEEPDVSHHSNQPHSAESLPAAQPPNA